MLTHKAGDSFYARFTLGTDLTDYGVRSALDAEGVLFPFVVEIIDATIGQFSVTATAAETSLWPVGIHNWDVKYEKDGVITSFPRQSNILLKVMKGPTQ